MKDRLKSLENFWKALAALERATVTPPVEERDYAGIIQNFELTYETCWKAIKAVLETESIEASFPRVVFEEAFKAGMIQNPRIWKAMIEARNLSTHTYDQIHAQALVRKIQSDFLSAFQAVRSVLEKQARPPEPSASKKKRR